jgi:hypothetical protein
MPAFAGMTRERAGGGRNPFIRDFNRMAYIFLLFKKSTPFFLPTGFHSKVSALQDGCATLRRNNITCTPVDPWAM